MVDVPGVTSLGHETGAWAQALPQQVLVHFADRQEHRDRGMLAVGRAVANDEQPRALAYGSYRGAGQLVQGAAQPVGPTFGVPHSGKRGRGHAGHVLERCHFLLQQDRVVGAHEAQPG